MLPLIVFVIPAMAIYILQSIYRFLFVTPTELQDKVVLVTGASSGLGEACCKLLLSRGSKVIMCARNVKELERVKKSIGEPCGEWPMICKMDVTDVSDIEACYELLKSKNIHVDIIVSNAGLSQRATIIDSIRTVYEKIMNVNVFGPINLVKRFLPDMISRGGGHIVSIGSVQARISIPFRSAYAASKHASQAFFDSLRAEVAKDNVKVTVINPGYIRTNLSLNAMAGDGGKHGVLDETTASGMSPEYVAEQIIDCIKYKTNELVLADMKSYIAIILRVLLPSFYFKLMEWRANKEYRKRKKSS